MTPLSFSAFAERCGKPLADMMAVLVRKAEKSNRPLTKDEREFYEACREVLRHARLLERIEQVAGETLTPTGKADNTHDGRKWRDGYETFQAEVLRLLREEK